MRTNVTRTMLGGALLLVLTAAPLAAQEVPAGGEAALHGESTGGGPLVDGAETDRATIRAFLGRDDVRKAARIAGLDEDLETRLDGLDRLEGERLSRAADQVRALDLDDRITLKASTIVILLLVLIIVLIAA